MTNTAAELLERLLATSPPPPLPWLAAAIALGALLAVWRRSRTLADPLVTVAHEAGHAVAAMLTRGKVHRIHIHADGSGATWSSGGYSPLVSLAGYPFPPFLGAMLLMAALSDRPRLWAAALTAGLLVLALRVRNAVGWLVVLLSIAGAAALARYAPQPWPSLALAAGAGVLLVGGLRDLFVERRARAAGRTTDVANLASRGRLPAPLYWLAMLAAALGCWWWAYRILTTAYGV